MKTFAIFCLVGFSLVSVQGLRTPSESDSSLLDDILRKITTSILNARSSIATGSYEVADDGSIHFVRGTTSTVAPTTNLPTTNSPTTSEPNLSDDESVKDYFDGDEEVEGTLWEFVPHRVEPHDPLRDSEEFPLVDTNEVETDEDSDKKPKKFSIVERRRRDVNVDVGGDHGVNVDVNKPGKNVKVNVGGQGGSGGYSGGSGVDVNVNKPGHNVAVNVGGIQDFLTQFGIHFNGGKPAGTYGSGSNVDVNVGDKPGHNNNVDVSVQKPHKGGNTNVAVDWASFIPFINVGVNKKQGGSKVDVNVGQNGGSGSSLVDVNVNEDGHPSKKKVIVRAPFVDVDVDGDSSAYAAGEVKKNKKVVVHAPFVDVNVDGDFPPPPPHPHPPHHPPKKHHYKHHGHDDDDKNVSVNVGGQGHGSWGSFVNVAVDGEHKAPQGKTAGRKCIKINVPFVNVLLNRGCQPEAYETSA